MPWSWAHGLVGELQGPGSLCQASLLHLSCRLQPHGLGDSTHGPFPLTFILSFVALREKGKAEISENQKSAKENGKMTSDSISVLGLL